MSLLAFYAELDIEKLKSNEESNLPSMIYSYTLLTCAEYLQSIRSK